MGCLNMQRPRQAPGRGRKGAGARAPVPPPARGGRAPHGGLRLLHGSTVLRSLCAAVFPAGTCRLLREASERHKVACHCSFGAPCCAAYAQPFLPPAPVPLPFVGNMVPNFVPFGFSFVSFRSVEQGYQGISFATFSLFCGNATIWAVVVSKCSLALCFCLMSCISCLHDIRQKQRTWHFLCSSNPCFFRTAKGILLSSDQWALLPLADLFPLRTVIGYSGSYMNSFFVCQFFVERVTKKNLNSVNREHFASLCYAAVRQTIMCICFTSDRFACYFHQLGVLIYAGLYLPNL